MGNLNKHETGKIETVLKNGKTTDNKKHTSQQRVF